MTNETAESANGDGMLEGVKTDDFTTAYHAVEHAAGEALDLHEILTGMLSGSDPKVAKELTLALEIERRLKMLLEGMGAVWVTGNAMQKELKEGGGDG